MKKLIVSLVVMPAWMASAATQTWTGASSVQWTNAANWSPATVPALGDDLLFNAASTANLATVLGTNFTIRGLTVLNPTGAVSLASDSFTNRLTLGAQGFNLSGASQDLSFSMGLTLGTTQTWNVAAGRLINANGSITAGSTSPFIKDGPGQVRLNANNTFSGGLVVSNGLLMTIGNQANARIQSGATVGVRNGGTFAVGEVNAYNNGITPTIDAGGLFLLTNYNGAAGFHAHIGNVVLNGGTMLGAATAPYQGESAALDGGFTITTGGTNKSQIAATSGFSLGGARTFTVADATADANPDLQIDARLFSVGSLIKAGAGTLLLTSTNGYTGTTTINAGRLALGSSASIASSPAIIVNTGGVFDATASGGYTVPSTQTLQGFSGSFAGNITLNDSRILPGAAGQAGTLIFSNDLVLAGATSNSFDIGGGLNDRIDVIGALTASSNKMLVNATHPLTNGTYTIMTYGTKSGSFDANPVHATRKTIVVDETTPGQVNLLVSGPSGASLRWNATNSTAWDAAVSTNWFALVGASQDVFRVGDDVLFDDTAGVTTAIAIATTVTPGSMVVDASTNAFTIGGVGKISGSSGLVKSGATNLILGGTGNDFTGPVTISNGTLMAATASALGATNGITTVLSGATLDVGGQSLGQEPVFIAGSGVGGNGAIVNGGAQQTTALQYLTLNGAASIGGTNRWDVRAGVNPFVNLNGFALTKTGTNYIAFVATAVTNTGDIVVSQGTLAASVNTVISGAGTVTVHAGGTFAPGNFGNTVVVTKPILLNGGTLQQDPSSGGATVGSPVSLNVGAFTNAIGAPDSTLNLTNVVSGAGGFTKTGSSTVNLTADNTYAGGTLITSGNLQIGNNTSGGSVLGPITNNANLYYYRTNAFLLPNAISGTGSVFLRTTGGMTVDGTAPINVANQIVVGQGVMATLILTNGANVNASSYIGFSGDAASYIRIYPGATLTTLGNIDMGNAGTDGSFSDVSQFGGTVSTFTTAAGEPGLRIGHWDNEVSIYRMIGGTLNVTSGTSKIWLGIDGIGILDVQGGVVNARQIDVDGRSNTGAFNGTNETLIVTGGRLNVGAGGIQTAGSGNVFLGGGTLGALATWAAPLPIQLTGTNGPTQFDPAGNTITLSGALTGTGGVSVTGGGMLWLSATNQAFTGTSFVQTGNLVLAGAAAGAVTVNTGGVLVVGTTSGVSSALTLPQFSFAGGRLSVLLNPANAPLRVTATDTLTVASGAIAVAGDVALGTFPVIDYNGTVQGAGVAGLGVLPVTPRGGGGYLVDDTVNTLVNLVVTNLGTPVRWVGGVNNQWDINVTTNWLTTDAPAPTTYLQNPNGDLVLFDDTAANFTVNIPSVVTPTQITVSNAANNYTLGGAAIAGAGSLGKWGAARLTLTGTNVFSGRVSVNGGTLTVASDASLGVTPAAYIANAVTVGDGSTLELLNTLTLPANRGITVGPAGAEGTATVSIASGATVTQSGIWANNISGTGAVIKTGAGTLILGAGNTFRGGLIVNAGTVLALGNQVQNRLAGASRVTINNGGTFVFGEVNALPLTTNVIHFTINNGGTLLLTNYTGAAGFHAHLNTITLNGGQMLGRAATNAFAGEDAALDGDIFVGGTNGSLMSTANAFNLGGGTRNFTVADATGDAATDLLVDGRLSGTTLAKYGPGTMTLTGTNVYAGGTIIGDGVLAVDLIADGGTSRIGTAGGAGNYLALSGGTLRFTGTGTNTTTRNLWMDQGSGTFDIADPSGTLVLSPAGGAVTRGVAKRGPGALVLNGAIGGTSFVAVTAGSLTLNGSCSHTGPTDVTNATLVVNGTIGTSAMTIAPGATLVGSGTVASVISRGLVSPGPGLAVLNSGDFTQQAGGTLRLELGGTASYDILSIGGTATFGGALEIAAVNGYVPALGDTFVIMTYAALGGGFATTNLPALAPGLAWSLTLDSNFALLSVVSGPSATGYDLAATVITNGLTGYQDDADGDGYANLLEYVTGGSLTNAGVEAKMQGTRTNGLLALRFTRDTNAIDATIVVEGSTSTANSATWLGIATNIGGSWGAATNVFSAGTNSPLSETVYDTDSGTNRFLRLRVTRP